MVNATETMMSLMARLKSETSQLHDSTEQHPFQQALVNGQLPRSDYVAFLKQLYCIHHRLETELIRQRSNSAINHVVLGHEYKLPFLLADLAYFGVTVSDIAPTSACAELVNELSDTGRNNPSSLLGHLYVLEGSTNGAKFIARALSHAYGLTTSEGLSYYDPYGNRQRELWQGFKLRMDELELTAIDEDIIVRSAVGMFNGIRGVADDLHTAQS